MFLIKPLGFAFLAPFGLFIFIFKEMCNYRYYINIFSEMVSFANIILLCMSTFYFVFASISCIIAVLMIFIWPLQTKILNIIERKF